MVDAATRYQGEKRLINETSGAIWDGLKTCWLDVYLGPPDVITHEAGTNLSPREFATNRDLLHIRLDTVPKEIPQSMNTVERKHGVLQRAVRVINATNDKQRGTHDPHLDVPQI